jgi:urease accessory protein
MKLKHSLLVVPMMVVAIPALGHTGSHAASGLADGFAHPFSGLDHTLAMVAVGLLAAVLGGRALWAIPASFVSMMLVGGFMGLLGIEIPAVEAGIALSVVILGAVLAAGGRCLISVAMTLTGIFAIFHGYAHGMEMPPEAAATLCHIPWICPWDGDAAGGSSNSLQSWICLGDRPSAWDGPRNRSRPRSPPDDPALGRCGHQHCRRRSGAELRLATKGLRAFHTCLYQSVRIM